ncbi:DUF559 domain-containing protein [Flexivirga oryzae]|uniref:DUF559 domain-containing protein n=1 Tax=Flexivirga oryzae TaxID=1794944 RepID=A0A839N243_9MICO|nr:DUF559 domain-containing protein [Flexivirga oryzae]MBB2891778.1 hypothetical protein [Flexivirga oryzae]
MVRTPSPLPVELGTSFTTREAIAHGVTLRRLRHRALATPTRGLRLTSADPDLVERAAAHLKVLPARRSAYSHATASALLGLPDRKDPRLHVTLPDGVFVRRRGMVMHRGLQHREIWSVHDLPVVSPVETWLDLAPLRTLEELVILGDAILQHQPDLATTLRHTVEAHSGARGIRRARDALELVRPGVLSPQETLWRLRFRAAGYPEPELNVEVRDPAGRWLGIGDFVWREQRLVVEYDGDYHFTVEQRRHDQVRRRAMRTGDWAVIELNGADNADPRPALRSIGAALGVHR